MTSYLEFDSEKVDQNEVFHYKDIYYISSQNDPNITHTKNYIWGKSHFKLVCSSSACETTIMENSFKYLRKIFCLIQHVNIDCFTRHKTKKRMRNPTKF
jgi:hypothetical protein